MDEIAGVHGGEAERARLTALYDLNILDTPREPEFDDVVSVAAAICRTPIAIINFVDADRQWGKACFGVESIEAPRAASFCATTITRADGMLVIPDTRRHPEWSTNPQVTGAPGLRFYAGAVVRTAAGQPVGSLCVADNTRPRTLDGQALDALSALARATARMLELRDASGKLADAYRTLREVASTDQLTGTVNRAMFDHSLGLALRQSARSGRPLGVLFCDLDGLKQINDRLGHSAGDDLLRGVADRLISTARAADVVARFGGDEFVILCPDLAAGDDLERVARRVEAAVTEPLHAGGETVRPRLSIGGAIAEPDDDPDRLLARADADMYRVKRGETRVLGRRR